MKHRLHSLIDVATWRRLNRRMTTEPILRRAVLSAGVALSAVCYVLAVNAGR